MIRSSAHPVRKGAKEVMPKCGALAPGQKLSRFGSEHFRVGATFAWSTGEAAARQARQVRRTGLPKVFAISAAALLLLGLQPAQAQPNGETLTVEEALHICAEISDPTDRLACFEKLARSVATDARKFGPRQAAEGAEGKAGEQPRHVLAGADGHAKQARPAANSEKRRRAAYDAIVLRAWSRSDGDYFVALVNGEIWKTQAQDVPRPIKDGEDVVLRPGGFGGWFMEFKTLSRPAIKVTIVR